MTTAEPPALVKYDAMCTAIQEAYKIDEVKSIRDKAKAMQEYARQANNTEAEDRCREIRLRAERRTGELIREQQAAGLLATRKTGNPSLQVSAGTTLPPATLSDYGISRDQSSRWQQLADVPDGEFEDEVAQPGATTTSILNNHRAIGTGVNEWYTPETYIIAARDVMGGIDLDPASSEQANECVRAAEIFTIEDDGLMREWHGRVWLNPPYAQPAISYFAQKVAKEWNEGNIDSAIVLTHNYTDTTWFHGLANSCQAICFTRGRIGFLSPNGTKAAPTQGQAFFYFGEDVERFAAVFADIGFVVKLINSTKGEPE